MKNTIMEYALMLSRSVDLTILIKATFLLLLGLAAVAVAAHAKASLRHLLLASTFAGVIALPFVVMVAPDVAIEVPAATSPAPVAVQVTAETIASAPATRVQKEETAAGAASAWPSLLSVLRGLWIAGGVLLIATFMVDLYRIRKLRRNGIPSAELSEFTQSLAADSGVRRQVEVLLHEEIKAPFTCGFFRPAILLPRESRDWQPADLRRAIVHELEHVRRGDWMTQLGARAVCTAFWFHPLVWAAWRRFCLEAERACDDAVVRTEESTDYAEQLVQLSQQLAAVRQQPILGMAKRSDLSRRVTAILDSTQNRGRVGLAAAACSILVAGFVVVSIGPLRAVAQTAAPPAASTDPGRGQKMPDTREVSRLDRMLVEAASEGNMQDVLALLDRGANANAAVPGDGSPLIQAAQNGHIEIVKLLLDRGADVNLGVEGDGNPLIMAAREGRENIVTLLLDRGADINRVVPSDENALIQAAGEGRLKIVKLLLSRGADPNIQVTVERGNGTGLKTEVRSALNMARKGRHGDVVEYLLSQGAREQ